MFPQTLNDDAFKDWTPKQRRDEIEKLVVGYRNGLPLGILCKMSESIAGSRKKAKKILCDLLTLEERQTATDKESGGMKQLAAEMLL
jgi:hypothetical protein